jgi:hypothetical protein
MSSRVYRFMSGDIVAYLEGDLLYGPSGGGSPIASVEGDGIWPGNGQVGCAPFELVGDGVYCGGTRVFTISEYGDTMRIGDGGGQSPHLDTPDGDPMALAAAAVAYLGDMRMRNPGAGVVPPSIYPSYERGLEHHDWGSNETGHSDSDVPWADRDVPDEIRRQFGDCDMPRSERDTFQAAKYPVGRPDKGDTTGMDDFDSPQEFYEDDNKEYNQGPTRSRRNPNSTYLPDGYRMYYGKYFLSGGLAPEPELGADGAYHMTQLAYQKNWNRMWPAKMHGKTIVVYNRRTKERLDEHIVQSFEMDSSPLWRWAIIGAIGLSIFAFFYFFGQP